MALQIKTKLPDHFLEDEVRSGYLVTQKQKKIWAVELDLLEEFDRVCTKHGIKYQIFAGTLLGAVRHGAMIPWDDDIDVALDRENWNRLCDIAQSEFSPPYFFQTALSDRKIYTPYARLRNSSTTAITSRKYVPGYNFGIYIDVLVLDGMIEEPAKKRFKNLLLSMATKCCTSYYGLFRARGFFGKVVAALLFPIIRILPYVWWVRIHNEVAALWTEDASYLGLVSSFQFGEKYKIPKTEFAELKRIKFEHITVCAPVASEKILTRIYGDYMRFPPASQRGAWHNGKIVFEPDVPYAEFKRTDIGKAK